MKALGGVSAPIQPSWLNTKKIPSSSAYTRLDFMPNFEKTYLKIENMSTVF
jgi:hypothetical protein